MVKSIVDKVADAVARKQQSAELQLHRARMIRASAPDLFRSLTNKVAEVMNGLAATAPGDRLAFEKIPSNGFKVSKSTVPGVVLNVNLNLDAQRIEIRGSKSQGLEFDQAYSDDFVKIRLDGQDELTLTTNGDEFTSVADLAEWITSKLFR